MRKYDKCLIDKLLEPGYEKDGVIFKPVPDDSTPGVLDSRERDILKEWIKNAADGNKLSLLDHRRRAGYLNFNLNEVEIIPDVAFVPFRNSSVRLWIYKRRKPFDRAGRPAVLYIHGGGFFTGSPFTMENPMRLLAEKADAVVFNIEYSLAPEKKYPTQIEECCAALDYIIINADKYGIDPKKICISGDSAGASIAIATAMRNKEKIALEALYYPACDMLCKRDVYDWDISHYEISKEDEALINARLGLGRMDGKGNVSHMMMLVSLYLGEPEKAALAEVSPVYADLTGMPKTIMFLSEFDGLRIQDEYFATRLKKFGVDTRVIIYRGVTHAFLEKMGFLPQAEASVCELAKEIKTL